MFIMMNEKAAESEKATPEPARQNRPYNPYQDKGGQEMLSRLNSNIAHVRLASQTFNLNKWHSLPNTLSG